jgi:Zn-finger nucleic acid-binding protein
MTYRDRPLSCPDCRVELARSEIGERWQCPRCRGVCMGVGEIAARVLAAAPQLRPAGRVDGVSTPSRRPESGRRVRDCPRCGTAMRCVYLGGAPIERCDEDALLWLDPGELDAIATQAQAQAREGRGVWRSLVRALRW